MSAPDRNSSRIAGDLKTAADATTPRGIDLDAVLGASRARRRARRTAIIGGAGAAVAVLVVGGLVFGVQGGGPFTSTTADSSAESGAVPESAESGAVPEPAPLAPGDEAPGGATQPQEADGVNQCGHPIDVTSPATGPLTAELVVPVRADAGSSVAVEVVVTNDSAATVTGELGAVPSLIVGEDGVVVWRTANRIAVTAQPIALDPGESITLPASFETRRCGIGDELLGARADDPPLEAGMYAVSAVVEFAPSGSVAAVAIMSPAEDIAVD